MTTEEKDIAIMDILDGKSDLENTAPELLEEAEELQQIVLALKAQPMQEVPESADARLQQLVASKRRKFGIKTLWPVLAVAASVVLIVFNLNPTPSFENQYQDLDGNPQKLSFIYELNESELSASDIDWLTREIEKDISPNIKVTIIDLLSSYQDKLDASFYANLTTETIPSVQMALLNSAEASAHLDLSQTLQELSERENLENTVREKIKTIISKQ